jgi:EpsI family protein
MTSRKTTLALAAAALIGCYAGVLAGLAHAWVTSEVYSYGLAVVAVAAYMFWTKSSHLRSLPAAPDYLLGLPVVALGLSILAAGHIALMTSLQQASFVITAAGLVLLLFGRLTFLCVWFPLAYVLLGLPIWDTPIAWLQPPSQWLSGRVAVGLLHAVGTPAVQEGHLLALPRVTLDVLRECSGVNQLLAVVAMTLPAGFIFLTGFIRRATLLVLSIVCAYLSNGVRIALVGVMAVRGLSDGDLSGLHLFQGLLVSALCYLVIIGLLSLLARTQPTARPVQSTSEQRPSTARHRRIWLECTICAAMVAVGAALPFFHTPDVSLDRDLKLFPTQIEGWLLESLPQATRFPALDDDLVQAYPSPEGAHRFLAIDDELVRAYRNSSGQQVRLYIGYHRSQKEGKELAGETSHLLNAASTPTPIRLRRGSETVELAEIVRDGRSGRRGVLYWYDVNGRVVSNIYRVKKYMAFDALTRRRSNGAVVMIEWGGADGIDPDASRRKAVAFAQSILPLLPNFIPS